MPKFAGLTERIKGASADVWDLHYAAAAAALRGDDVIVLSAGDPDFATPPPVVERACAALRDGDTRYTPVAGCDSLRAAIARRHCARSGQAVTADNVVVAAGGQNALLMASLCLLEHGDEVIVPQPMYVTFEAVARAGGAELVAAETTAADGFKLQAAALRTAVSARTRAILLASPANPTGAALTADEWAAVAAVAAAHDLWVIADEVYADLVYDGEFAAAAATVAAERVVTVGSMSKSFAMSGWRVGWAVAPAAVAANMEKLALCMLYGLPGFAQEAAAYALTHCAAETARMRAAYRRRRDLLFELLAEVDGVAPLLPQAGMFMLADVRASGMSAADFARGLYDAVGVSVLDAGAFGAATAGHIRLSLTADEATLREAARRIKIFLCP